MLHRFFVFLCLFLVLPFYAHAVQSSGQSAVTPWSGHWWPFSKGGIGTGLGYRGHPAPLEKYLLLATGSTGGEALDWYLDRYYDPDAERWWGLCPAYARAAIKESYPILPSVHDNIVFRVGDKKGLLTICHDSRAGIIYAYTDSPVNFHLWLLDYIGDQKKAFAADLGSGDEVWYFPVFAYEMDSDRSRTTEEITVTIYYAAHMEPDYMGTQQMEKAPFTYTLDLDAQGNIIGGQWTGKSVNYHPKVLSYPDVTGPVNPYLEGADCERIREIAQARDDTLELPENASVRLLPGSYNLVLLDADNFLIQGTSDDLAVIDLARQQGSNQKVYAQITDADNAVVRSYTLLTNTVTVRFLIEMDNPPYLLEITQDEYLTEPNIYSLMMDFQSANDYVVPYIPQNGPWSGFSLTNGSDENSAEVMLVTMDDEGLPIQTVFGPVQVEPGEKCLLQYSDLPVRNHEFQDTVSVRLIADQPVDMVNLFANNQGPMAGFAGSMPVQNRLILADTYDNDPWDPVYMTGAVVNTSFSEIETLWNVYSDDGDLVRSFSQSISSRGRVAVKSGTGLLGTFPDGGWMEIASGDSDTGLFGYQYLEKKDGQKNMLDTSFAFPVISGNQYVQHITPSTGPWQTLLTVINPNPDNNEVVIHSARDGIDSSMDMRINLNPYEKQMIDISSDFGNAGDRSILEISGEFPLSGYVAYMAGKGDASFYPLLNNTDFKTELIMPHVAYNQGRWYTGVGVCNPNDYRLSVSITPYDHNGQALIPMGIELSLDPGGYEVFTVHNMFPSLINNTSFLKIQAVDPSEVLIGGFYLYGNAGGQNLAPRQLVSGGNM